MNRFKRQFDESDDLHYVAIIRAVYFATCSPMSSLLRLLTTISLTTLHELTKILKNVKV